LPGDSGSEGGTGREAGLAAGHGLRDAKCRVEQFRREGDLEAQGPGDVPGVHDVVDEVEADRLPGGEGRRARELRQRKLAVEHAFCGKRGQHRFRGRAVAGDGIGAQAAGTPPGRVAVAG
jgi:hypothetical protein